MTATFRRIAAPTLAVDRMLLVWGLLLGVVAAGCAAGLFALAGWFLAMCAAAGGGLAVSFSYLYPSGAVRALAVGRVGTRYLERLVEHRISLDAAVAQRTDLFRAAGSRDCDERSPVASGDLLGRLTTDVDTVDSLLIRVLAPAVSTVVVVVAVVGLLALVDWRASVVAATGAAVLTIAAMRPAAAGLDEDRQASAALGAFHARLVELLIAAPELASYDIGRLAVDELHPSLEKVEGHHRRALARIATAGAYAPAGALALGVLNVAIIAGHVQGPTRAASLAAVAFATFTLVELIESLPAAGTAYGHIRTAAARLDEVSTTSAVNNPPSTGGATAPLDVSAIDVRRVTYQRGSADLDKLDVRLDAPGTLLVTGPSGAGKTTLIRLISGRVVPQSGSLRVFGHDPTGLTNAERAQLLVAVDQQPLHVTGTVADNLRIGRPDATDDELEHLLHAFRLDGDGALHLDDEILDGGEGLSGGQRRRLAIARAVLKAPAILALDEPTEGLDDDTATAVLTAVRALLPSCVLILVMHDRNLDQLGWAPDRTVLLQPTWARAASSPSPTLAVTP